MSKVVVNKDKSFPKKGIKCERCIVSMGFLRCNDKKCNRIVCERCSITCYKCNKDLCLVQDKGHLCTAYCHGCKQHFCEKDYTQCSAKNCSAIRCSKCIRKCSDCRKPICARHGVKYPNSYILCTDCDDCDNLGAYYHEEEEEEEETSEEVEKEGESQYEEKNLEDQDTSANKKKRVKKGILAEAKEGKRYDDSSRNKRRKKNDC